MNRIRQSFVKRSLSALLSLTMVLGMGIINVFCGRNRELKIKMELSLLRPHPIKMLPN